jgi:hypothetical protein
MGLSGTLVPVLSSPQRPRAAAAAPAPCAPSTPGGALAPGTTRSARLDTARDRDEEIRELRAQLEHAVAEKKDKAAEEERYVRAGCVCCRGRRLDNHTHRRPPLTPG